MRCVHETFRFTGGKLLCIRSGFAPEEGAPESHRTFTVWTRDLNGCHLSVWGDATRHDGIQFRQISDREARAEALFETFPEDHFVMPDLLEDLLPHLLPDGGMWMKWSKYF